MVPTLSRRARANERRRTHLLFRTFARTTVRYVSQHWNPPSQHPSSAPANPQAAASRDRRAARLRKVVQVPLGLHLTLAAARGLEAAWASPKPTTQTRVLVSSTVYLHNEGRRENYALLKAALKKDGVDLSNRFPIKAGEDPLAIPRMNKVAWDNATSARTARNS